MVDTPDCIEGRRWTCSHAVQLRDARILVLHQAIGCEFDEVNWVDGDFAADSDVGLGARR